MVQEPSAGGQAGFILVVEDDEALARLMEALLVSDGYQVRLAMDGQAALDLVAVERPALVILDAVLPKADGWQVLARLRADRPEVPVVFVTGQTRAAERATRAGAAAAILKPFDVDELLHLVASLMRQ